MRARLADGQDKKSQLYEKPPAEPSSLHRSSDLEALDVILGLRWIERLAHDREGLRVRGRRREPGLLHELGSIGREINLLGHRLVVDVALDLTPALHLGHDPDRERLPGERVEVDP